MMSLRFRVVLPLVIGSLAIAAAGYDAAPPRTTFDAVYTSAQATRGKDKFTLICLSCHDMDEHKAILKDVWFGKPLSEFFDYLVTEMPSGDPGTMSRQEYADVTAYILQLNGMPAGEHELPPAADSMTSIRIDTIASVKDSTAMHKDSMAVRKDTVATDTLPTDTIAPDTTTRRVGRSNHGPAWLRSAALPRS